MNLKPLLGLLSLSLLLSPAQAQQDQTKPAAQEVNMTSATLYHEVYRPQYHFTAPTGWINDPNGLVYAQGEYHLFYQYHPNVNPGGDKYWGHAVGTDLVHWKHLPIAIKPNRLGGIWSGSAVVDQENTAEFQQGNEKTIAAFYTAAGDFSTEGSDKGIPFTQCMAWSGDRGRTWHDYDGNPVIKQLAGGNRDPKVVWHAPTKRWIMVLYLDRTRFAFFNSPDLKQWTKIQEIDVPGCSECPDFFEMPIEGQPNQTKWIWTSANGRYVTGDFDGQRFTPDTIGTLQVEFGGQSYAGQTYSDIPAEDGRRILITWMAVGEYPKMPFTQQLSLPCELRLRQTPVGLRLFKTPVRELEALRGTAREWHDLKIKPGDNPLAEIKGDLLEVEAELQPDAAETECTLNLRGATVTYRPKDRTLTALGHTAPVEPGEGGRIKIHAFLDRTSLEVYVNDGEAALTSCFVPAEGDQTHALTCAGGPATLRSVKVWPLHSIWQ